MRMKLIDQVDMLTNTQTRVDVTDSALIDWTNISSDWMSFTKQIEDCLKLSIERHVRDVFWQILL